MTILRVIDFETTGLPPNAHVIEIGWTDVTIGDGSPEQGFAWHIGHPQSMLVDPGHPIEPAAQAVHHISPEELVGKPHPQSILREAHIGVTAFVAHNAAFEKQLYDGAGLPWICTMRGARKYIQGTPNYQNQTLRYFLRLPADPFKCQPAHRAGPDTYVTAHLLVYLLEKKGAKLEELYELEDKPQLLEICTFGTKHKGQTWATIPTSYMLWLLANNKPDRDVKYTMIYHLKARNSCPPEYM